MKLLDYYQKYSSDTVEQGKNLCALDVGSGTGFVANSAINRKLLPSIIRLDISESMLKQDSSFTSISHDLNNKNNFVCADLQCLPIKNSSLDVCLSSYALQWSNNISELFSELNRVLKQEGIVYFSIPGPNTFKELRSAWASIDNDVHVHHFETEQAIIDAANKHKFELLHCSQQEDVLLFPDQKSALAHIKRIGAHNLDENRNKTLLGKSHFKKFSQAFENSSKVQDQYSLSYESYFFGFKK